MNRGMRALVALTLALSMLCGCSSPAVSAWIRKLYPAADESVAAQQAEGANTQKTGQTLTAGCNDTAPRTPGACIFLTENSCPKARTSYHFRQASAGISPSGQEASVESLHARSSPLDSGGEISIGCPISASAFRSFLRIQTAEITPRPRLSVRGSPFFIGSPLGFAESTVMSAWKSMRWFKSCGMMVALSVEY